MEYSDLILSRESVRNYDPDRPVPRETLEKILNAGRLAPSACNKQPWIFLVISSAEMLNKVRQCYHRDWFREAPHILVVMGYIDRSWKRGSDGHNSIETDLAIAMTHIILAAENEGVGTCWIANYSPDLLKKAIDQKENEVVFGITPLGYPKKGYRKTPKNRKPLDETARFL